LFLAAVLGAVAVNHVGACNGGGPVSICAEIAWAESMVMRRGVLRRQNIGLGRKQIWSPN